PTSDRGGGPGSRPGHAPRPADVERHREEPAGAASASASGEGSSLAADPTLTIVVVNYHALDYLPPCLAALEAAPPPVDYRVVLVDNSPGDGVAEAVRERFPAVAIVSNACNVGFARAC